MRMEYNLLPVEEQLEAIVNGDAEELPLDASQSMDLEFNLPPWFDKDKYKRGQDYIKSNIFSQYQVTLYGLLVVLAVPSVLNILMATKKSGTLKTAYKRYLSTMMHVHSWYYQELKPGTKAWNSLIAVRSRHMRASKTSQRNGKNYISQRDLVLTQFGFYGIGLIRGKFVGMQQGSDEDIEGYIHFWRTIGYMMGICDRYNLCRPSKDETIEVTQAICNQVYVPLLRNPPEYFLYMTMELLKAMMYIIPTVTEKSLFYFTFYVMGVPTFIMPRSAKNGPEAIEQNGKIEKQPNRIVAEVKTPKNCPPLDGKDIYSGFEKSDKTAFHLLERVDRVWVTYYLLRFYLNFQITLIMFLTTYFPFLCFYTFGFRDSYVDMFKEDKPMDFVPKTNKEMLHWFKNGETKKVKPLNNNNLIVN